MMKDSMKAVLDHLDREYPRFISVPELIGTLHQTDIRKRVSELYRVQDGFIIEKERAGRFVNIRGRITA